MLRKFVDSSCHCLTVCCCLFLFARTLKLVCTCVLTNFLVMLPLFWLLCFAPLLLPRARRATPGQLSATCSPFSSGSCPSIFPRAMPHVLRMATACCCCSSVGWISFWKSPRLWTFVDDLCGQVLRGSKVALTYMVWSPSAYPRRSQACRTFRTKSRNIVSLQRVCPIVTRGCGRLRRCDVCQWLSFEMPGRVLLTWDTFTAPVPASVKRRVQSVVARNAFRSQNVQNTPGSEHFWKL